MMINCGVYVPPEAKPGKEQAVADFLAAGLADLNGGRGGSWEDRGYQWYAGI